LRLASLVLALAACSAPTIPVPSSPLGDLPVPKPLRYTTVIHGDTRFEREERELAEYAAESWRIFSKGRIDVELVWDLDEPNLVRLRDSARMIRVSAEDPRTKAVETKHRLPRNVHAAAWFHPADEYLPLIIGIVPDAAPELTPVFLHEFGHAAGLDELPAGERGIMSVAYGAWRFSVADYRQCERARLCAGPPPPGLVE
jgi:hypothetical protein